MVCLRDNITVRLDTMFGNILPAIEGRDLYRDRKEGTGSASHPRKIMNHSSTYPAPGSERGSRSAPVSLFSPSGEDILSQEAL